LKKQLPKGFESFSSNMPLWTDNDFEIVSQPIDFIGINTYWGDTVKYNESGIPVKIAPKAGFEKTAFGWPVEPASLYWMPKFLWERYGKPIYVTENGLSNIDYLDEDGSVKDPQRISFTLRYLEQLNRAMLEGVDVRGYYHWSLMDNFEWAEGYFQRFGLIHVDFNTLARTFKNSANWYAEWIVKQKLQV
jgi:beta-glucosidase